MARRLLILGRSREFPRVQILGHLQTMPPSQSFQRLERRVARGGRPRAGCGRGCPSLGDSELRFAWMRGILGHRCQSASRYLWGEPSST